MKACRECRGQVSEQAFPLVHISFKYRANRVPVVVRGIVAIGEWRN